MGILFGLAALVAIVSFAGRTRAAPPPGVPAVPGPGTAPGPGATTPIACRPITGIGATDEGRFADSNGVQWCLVRTSGTPGSNVWQAYTGGYGDPERKVDQPSRELLIGAIQAFSLANKPPGTVASPAPGTAVPSPDSSPTCGPYPPLVSGWRPVCVTDRLAATAVIPPSTRVELTIQEGVRALDDSSQMMRIEGVVTGGNASSGYDVAFYGLVRQTNATSSPMIGTVFKGVRPSFINRIVTGAAPETTFPLPGLPGSPTSPATPVPALPPTIPSTEAGPLPPLPIVNSLGLSPGFQHGISIIPTEFGEVGYVWTRDPEGPKAPSGIDIILYSRGERAIFGLRSATGPWSFYYVDYLVALATSSAFITPDSSNFSWASSTGSTPTQVSAAEQAMMADGSVGARRAIEIAVQGSLEQITFRAERAGEADRVQVWTFRQLANWLL